jgi:hypothetical protein
VRGHPQRYADGEQSELQPSRTGEAPAASSSWAATRGVRVTGNTRSGTAEASTSAAVPIIATTYAGAVPTSRATAATPVPSAMKTFVTARSRARTSIRLSAPKDWAITVSSAVRWVAAMPSTTQATTTNATVP